MEKAIEIEGKTLEEATQQALEQLGARREDVDIEILDDGKAGFLGFGSRTAKIRAALRSGEGVPLRGTLIQETGRETHRDTRIDSRAKMEEDAEGGAVEMHLAKSMLSELIDKMNLQGSVTSRIADGQLHLNVTGEDSNILIGKKGQTLDAIQYLTSLMYNKSTRSKTGILVDVEDYRSRREQKLQSMAREAGEKVQRTGKPVTLAPMNAKDRRIIHIALQDEESLKTTSRGEGVMKKVVVLPRS